MPKLPALRKSLSPTAILASALLVSFSMSVAQAQQTPKGNNGEQGPYYVQRGHARRGRRLFTAAQRYLGPRQNAAAA